VGGLAKAAHANDSVAKAFISDHWFFRAADWQTTHVLPKLNGPWFLTGVIAFSLLIPVLMFAVGYRRKKSAL
jgi:hypothetical protein